MTDTVLQPTVQMEEVKGRSLWSDARARHAQLMTQIAVPAVPAHNRWVLKALATDTGQRPC